MSGLRKAQASNRLWLAERHGPHRCCEKRRGHRGGLPRPARSGCRTTRKRCSIGCSRRRRSTASGPAGAAARGHALCEPRRRQALAAVPGGGIRGAVRGLAPECPDGRRGAGMRALLFAGARRSAGDGQRRPAARPSDGAQGIRRGDRHSRRRRPAHLRLRHPLPPRDASRCRRAAQAGLRARAGRRPRRHGRRADARSRRRRALRCGAAQARRAGGQDACRR